MTIIRALPEDAGLLSSIAREAKGHWGYPEAWLRRWDDALTLRPGYIRSHPTYVVVAEGSVIGFFALILGKKDAVLDHLWVLPSQAGKGVGRLLFEYAEACARAAGASRLTVASDPHAEGFYIRMGAKRFGEVPAAMDGRERVLPLLEKPL